MPKCNPYIVNRDDNKVFESRKDSITKQRIDKALKRHAEDMKRNLELQENINNQKHKGNINE